MPKPSSFDLIREQHHTLAKLVASDRSLSEIAHIAGASISQLERLCLDPAFRDLVSRYRMVEITETSFQRFSYLCAA